MAGITRREFLKVSAGIAAASLLPKLLLAAGKEKPTGPIIAVARGDKTKLVKAALDELGGISAFVKKGDSVCIKPNISFAANAECGATTSAGVARQVVQLCLDAGAARVTIVDYTLAQSELCVDKSGIAAAVVDKSKVSILTLGKERQFAE